MNVHLQTANVDIPIAMICNVVAALKLDIEKNPAIKNDYSGVKKHLIKSMDLARKAEKTDFHTPSQLGTEKESGMGKFNRVFYSGMKHADPVFKVMDVKNVVSGIQTLTHMQSLVVASPLALTTANPLLVALTPMISAAQVFSMASRNMALKDLSDLAHVCECGTCRKGLEFIVDRDDGKAARIALSSTVVGLPFVALYTVGRKTYHKFQGDQSEKHQVAQNLLIHGQKITAAKDPKTGQVDVDSNGKLQVVTKGCPIAIATIATLFEDSITKGSCFIQTISALAAQDSIKEIKLLIA